jgi:hypothetical protein
MAWADDISTTAGVLLLTLSLLPIAMGVFLIKVHLRTEHGNRLGAVRGVMWILLGLAGIATVLTDRAQAIRIPVMLGAVLVMTLTRLFSFRRQRSVESSRS